MLLFCTLLTPLKVNSSKAEEEQTFALTTFAQDFFEMLHEVEPVRHAFFRDLNASPISSQMKVNQDPVLQAISRPNDSKTIEAVINSLVINKGHFKPADLRHVLVDEILKAFNRHKSLVPLEYVDQIDSGQVGLLKAIWQVGEGAKRPSEVVSGIKKYLSKSNSRVFNELYIVIGDADVQLPRYFTLSTRTKTFSAKNLSSSKLSLIDKEDKESKKVVFRLYNGPHRLHFTSKEDQDASFLVAGVYMTEAFVSQWNAFNEEYIGGMPVMLPYIFNDKDFIPNHGSNFDGREGNDQDEDEFGENEQWEIDEQEFEQPDLERLIHTRHKRRSGAYLTWDSDKEQDIEDEKKTNGHFKKVKNLDDDEPPALEPIPDLLSFSSSDHYKDDNEGQEDDNIEGSNNEVHGADLKGSKKSFVADKNRGKILGESDKPQCIIC